MARRLTTTMPRMRALPGRRKSRRLPKHDKVSSSSGPLGVVHAVMLEFPVTGRVLRFASPGLMAPCNCAAVLHARLDVPLLRSPSNKLLRQAPFLRQSYRKLMIAAAGGGRLIEDPLIRRRHGRKRASRVAHVASKGARCLKSGGVTHSRKSSGPLSLSSEACRPPSHQRRVTT